MRSKPAKALGLPTIRLVPTSIKAANRLVAKWHRHNEPIQGGYFAAAVESGGDVVGVAIVGHPIGRNAMDGFTCEITRVATDGTYNACSMLYGACCRAAKALGYRKVITKTGVDEPGTSLKAAGFVEVGLGSNDTWDRPKRRRIQEDMFGRKSRPDGPKRRWERVL